MRLKIDKEPKVGSLEFCTKQRDYAESSSPRTIIRQRGVEFDHFRAYQPDDDASLIDWKASARSENVLVRVYTEDRSMRIVLLVDVSESMIYGTGSKAKIEFALELALNLAYGSLKYGDMVGLVMFNEKIVSMVPYGSGVTHFSKISDTLLHHSEEFGGKLNLEYALNMVMHIFKGAHLVILISDFLGFGEYFYADMHAVFDQFDILGIMVYDKTDISLEGPGLYVNMIDPYSDSKGFVKTKHLQKLYTQANKERIEKIKSFLMTGNKDFWIFSTEDSIEKKLPKLLIERNELRE